MNFLADGPQHNNRLADPHPYIETAGGDSRISIHSLHLYNVEETVLTTLRGDGMAPLPLTD